MEYLATGRKILRDHALEIIAFCGTRVQLLKSTSDDPERGLDLKGLSTPLGAACVLL